MKQKLAIATCRVSSDEQLLNKSLERQREAVIQAAEELDVVIPKDGWWSGSISSKRGSNVIRKDLQQMIAYCKKDKRVKYLIVDEPDRFMRSIDEAAYFEVTFQQLGVRVWYASDSELNKGDLASKLLKFTKYLSAEGSNEERQRKSVGGLTKSLKEGYWPFQPKAGYVRGRIKGIPEIDEIRGSILKRILVAIAEHRKSPSEALVELNATDFVKGRSKCKMDKFRKICTDPFYAGVVEMNKQVKLRNEYGKHEPLITMEQHLELVDIFNNKKKNQNGPRKNGNPDYPLSNIVHCEVCIEERNGRYVGFKVNNGVNKQKIYHKYRCRSCKAYFTRDELHHDVSNYINDRHISDDGKAELLGALHQVWKDRRKDAVAEKRRIASEMRSLEQTIESRVDAVIKPENASIKDVLMRKIDDEKIKLKELQGQLDKYDRNDDAEKERFLAFALDRAENMELYFLALPKDKLQKCKQMLFPAGFWIDAEKKVYTPEMSILYRLAGSKKDTEVSQKASMVRVRRL